jgi:hypothetical protein
MSDRRDFLKKMLTAGALAAVCPHVLLGKIPPTIKEVKNGRISGIYTLDLNKYSMLKEIWGSVRLNIPTADGSTPPEVIITRLDSAEFGKNFSIVNTACPHEGQRLYDLHPDLHIFICSGHQSQWKADGVFVEGPAAVDLKTYKADPDWTPNMDALDILFDFEIGKAGVEDDLDFYVHKNYPNPFDKSSEFEYGLYKDTEIELAIYSLSGQKEQIIFSGMQSAGTYTAKIDGSTLTAGSHICSMVANGKTVRSFKIIKF